MTEPRNIIAGVACPPVVCQRRGPVFRWHNGSVWQQGDSLPLIIVTSNPPSEQERFRRHAETRGAA